MVLLLHHLHPRVSIATSPDYNRLRKSLHDVLLTTRFGLTRDLPLKRSLPYYSGSKQQQPKSPTTMATKSENLLETSTEEKDKVHEDKDNKDKKDIKDKKDKEDASLPPPPEKPEPGDCCGSGCVRCVWDVYYDELEEYNKQLSRPISGDTKSN